MSPGPGSGAEARALLGLCPYCFRGGTLSCDCRERVECVRAGEPGHVQCGLCPEHAAPRFTCGCLAPAKEAP